MKRTVLAVLVALSLAGCSPSSSPTTRSSATPSAATISSTPTSPAPASPPPSQSPTPAAASLTVEEAIAKTGCTGYKLADEAAPFAATYGTCRWKGNRLQLYTFDDEASREKFLDLSAQFGAPRSSVVVVGLLVAALDRQTDRALLRKTLLA